MKLRIAETFYSLQGEGQWVGTPSVFVRVSGCNLRCIWCDTPYASWEPEGPTVEVSDLVAHVLRFEAVHVVVTGGEPMLFGGVVELCSALKAAGKVITIETAGTVFQELECDLMSISPKLSNSTPGADSGWAERHEIVRRDRSALAKLCEKYDFQLKFVVDLESSPGDLEEIDALVSTLPKGARERVILMPEGVGAETIWRKARMLAPICLERGWRLSPRMHVDLYGNSRGT